MGVFSKASFDATLGALGVVNTGRIFAELAAAYDDPARHYHGQSHIAACLREFRQHRQSAARPAEVEAAIWFHDAIYDSRRNDNEERSAEWARTYLTASGVEQGAVEHIVRMILATKSHAGPADIDAQLLVDVDLAILGQPPEVFERYDQAIRREYAWVPEAQYRLGRAAVLRGFLAREHIYATDAFRARYEQQARENIARKVRALDGTPA